ncbi:NUDIX domain-containing protein [Bacteroidota bacterium]
MEDNVLENVSVGCTVFGFDKQLKVLLMKHNSGLGAGRWGIPGGLVEKDKSLDEAVQNVLFKLTGIENIFMEQTMAFGAVDRHPAGRIIAIGYKALIRIDDFFLTAGFTASDVAWFPVNQTPDLIFNHSEILNHALDSLKKKVRQEPIGFEMLPPKFTLHELQSLYESILGMTLDKPNFRRKINGMKLLVDTGEKEEDVSYRAAKLYRFDPIAYNQLKEQKFVLDF